MHCMFIHLFSKHWVSFQPKLPLGLGVAGYNRIFWSTSAWEEGVMIWGDQPICYRVVGIIKSISLGTSRRVSGPQEKDLVLKGFEITLSLGKLSRKEEGKSSVLEPNARTYKCRQW